MVRNICRDVFFLSRPAAEASIADVKTGLDLLETLAANSERCVGMAANMIGESKRIIVFNDDMKNVLMYNPKIIAKSGRYETEEGCLSLDGTRKCVRYRQITVEYLDAAFARKKQIFRDYTAEIIQHEIDHCDGIII